MPRRAGLRRFARACAVGRGGVIDGHAEVGRFARALGLGDEVMTCQTEGEVPSLTVLDPSGPSVDTHGGG